LRYAGRFVRLETQARTYILLLTAKGSKEDIVEGLEGGADDYIIKPFNKDELRARVEVGCRFIELENALADQVEELQKALDHIQTLQGIIPICSHCHKIRNDQESWERIENYIEHHSTARFSHSVCPECLDKYYPEDPAEEPAGVKTEG
jgi:sigma-B regulation protein RsbU (phosphoserine phosphatase)